MYLDFTPEQKAFRDELREYFAKLVTPELLEEMQGTEGGTPGYHRAMRQMAADGLLGISWPKEYGGQARGTIEQYIFSDEVQRAGFPLPFLTLNTIGPTLMRYGTDEQKREFLPKILRGELHFAVGYSEAEAGTDLASLKTKAERDGDEWVINGAKMWTSLADFADYIWLAARTDPTVKKHRGISMFLVPTSAPGYKYTTITTMSGLRTTATYYEDVRVPADNLIGGENNGWSLITGQLNHERISLISVGPVELVLEDTRAWAQQTKLADGRRVIDQPWVQSNLARVHAKLEVLRLMTWKQAWAMQHGHLHPADASATKVFATEFYIDAYRSLMEIFGSPGTVQPNSPGAALGGRLLKMYLIAPIFTFGGGTNEVQRDIIAMAALGMPRYKS